MKGTPWRLAIDFGTSNSAAAVAGPGGVSVLRLGTRSDAIPSCVAAYNGEIVTGEAALRIAGIYPAAFEPTPKRRLGEEEIVLGGTVCDPVDLVAAVLGFVLGQAERYVGGGSPAQVILTHPEAWDEYLQGRLGAAAVKAGIPEECLVLLPEPVAAAWHYAATSDVEVGAYVAVLDFGGGTCDAAVLELSQTAGERAFNVVASGGIDPLGGHDFDAQLEGWVFGQLASEGEDHLLEALKSERSAADRAVLRDQIREAKHALSFHGSAPIGIRSGEQERVSTVTRGEFEQLIEPQLNRAVQLVQDVIGQALPSVQQLHKVYLTGGSSHIPALQSKLNEVLPMKLGLMGDPKQVTSLGALEAPAATILNPGAEHRPASAADAGAAAGESAASERRVRRFSRGSRATSLLPSRKNSTDDRPARFRPSKTALIGGGVLASAVLVASAFMLVPGGAQQPTSRGSSPSLGIPSSSGTSSAAATVRECGGREQPGLSDGECNLLTSANGLGLVNPASCTGNRDLADANFGLVCEPPASSNFSSTERPAIYVYGYPSSQALKTAFDAVVNKFDAVQGSAMKSPGWETWHLKDDQTQTVRGRVLGASDGGSNYLVWTEEEPLMEIWAISKEADISKLYSWWHR